MSLGIQQVKVDYPFHWESFNIHGKQALDRKKLEGKKRQKRKKTKWKERSGVGGGCT